MPYLRSISQISDVSDGVIDELTKILDTLVGLKNEAVVPNPSATCPPPKEKPIEVQEGPREKEVTLKHRQPTIESAQPPDGALDKMETRLMHYINHVEEHVRAHYDAPLVEMNMKLDSLITLPQN